MAFGKGIAYATTGGKHPKLTAWSIADATQEWQVPLQDVPSGILLTDTCIVTYMQNGRVGEAVTIVQFRDLFGKILRESRLPDALSELVASKNSIYAGCRDGNLYAFTAVGEASWKFRVPGSENWDESPYSRPCPYYLCANDDLVVFSSFSDIYALNHQGRQVWRWSVPANKSSLKSADIEITLDFGAGSISGLALSSDGAILASTGNTVYTVSKGRVKAKKVFKDQRLGTIEADSTEGLWAATTANGEVNLFRAQSLAGKFAAPYNSSISLNAKANRVTCWSGKDLSIATATGNLITEIEFVKNIAGAYLTEENSLVVAAGHLIVLHTTAGKREVSTTAAIEMTKPSASTLEGKATDEKGIAVRWFEGEKILSASGKAKYLNPNGGEPVTIEQLAIILYGSLGYKGYWSENEYWSAIMALLFWGVIFARLPGVFTTELDFPGEFQDMPQDFFSDDFYQRRKESIEKRIRELSRWTLFGLKKPDIESEIRGSFRRNRNTSCRPMNWERYQNVEPLLMAPRVLSEEQLMLIMRRLLENFRNHRSGMPDLFLAKDSSPLFIEVKSEREKVADHQFQWLFYLRNVVGVPVEICRISG